MVLTSVLSMLALRPYVDGAVDDIRRKTDVPLKDKVEAAFFALVDRFRDHEKRLGDALTWANLRVWRTLELALAGESLRMLLDRQRDPSFRARICWTIDTNPLNKLVGDDAEVRRACLLDLDHARGRGLLAAAAPLELPFLLREACDFARFDDPAERLEAECAAFSRGIGSLRADYPNLARLLGGRSPGGPSPLIVAVRYCFRRAIERDPTLKQAAFWSSGDDGIDEDQARVFEFVQLALDEHDRRLETLLEEVRDVAQKSLGKGLDIKAEHERRGRELDGLYEAAREMLERFDRLNQPVLTASETVPLPKDAHGFFRRGYEHQSRGEHDLAIASYRETILIDPKFSAAYYNRGLAHHARGEHDRAIADFDEAIALNPESAAYLGRGNTYQAKGKHDRAIADYSEAIRLNPGHVSAYIGRGNALLAKGEHDRAIADYAEAIRLDPKSTFAYIGRGNAHLARGRHDLAIADYSEAIRLNPKYASGYYNRGLAHHAQGKHNRAIADFDEAIALNPEATAYLSRGNAHLARASYDRAIADYSEAIRIDPKYSSGYYNRGLAYQAQRKHDRANADFEMAKRLKRGG